MTCTQCGAPNPDRRCAYCGSCKGTAAPVDGLVVEAQAALESKQAREAKQQLRRAYERWKNQPPMAPDRPTISEQVWGEGREGADWHWNELTGQVAGCAVFVVVMLFVWWLTR